MNLKGFWGRAFIIAFCIYILGSASLLPNCLSFFEKSQSLQSTVVITNDSSYFENEKKVEDAINSGKRYKLFEMMKDGTLKFTILNKVIYMGSDTALKMLSAIMVLMLPIFLIIILLFTIVDVFLLNPLVVTLFKWFAELDKGNRITDHKSLLFVFKKENYSNIVKVMFFKNLKIFLWTLLLIIPGIIKAYQYFPVNYILGQNPTMGSKEVFALSKKMTKSIKWKLFVMDLSFIGWFIPLAIITYFTSSIFILALVVRTLFASALEAYVVTSFSSLYNDLEREHMESNYLEPTISTQYKNLNMSHRFLAVTYF